MAPSSLVIQAGSLETCRLSAYYSNHLIRPTMHSWRPAISPGLMPVGHFLSECAVISGIWMTATLSRNHFTSSFPSDCHHPHSTDGGIFHRDTAWHTKGIDAKWRATGGGERDPDRLHVHVYVLHQVRPRDRFCYVDIYKTFSYL